MCAPPNVLRGYLFRFRSFDIISIGWTSELNGNCAFYVIIMRCALLAFKHYTRLAKNCDKRTFYLRKKKHTVKIFYVYDWNAFSDIKYENRTSFSEKTGALVLYEKLFTDEMETTVQYTLRFAQNLKIKKKVAIFWCLWVLVYNRCE